MTETFKDIHAAIASQNNKNLLAVIIFFSLADPTQFECLLFLVSYLLNITLKDSNNPNLDALTKRKLHRMELVRKLSEKETMPQLLGYHKRIIDERRKDLR